MSTTPHPDSPSLRLAAVLHNGEDNPTLRGAEWIIRNLIKNPPKSINLDEEMANELLYQMLIKVLLKGGLYQAAKLCWGNLFTIEPDNVGKLWHALQTERRLGVIGAGALGKSFTIVMKFFLDYHADPAYTTCKLISTTAAAGASNIWSQITTLHKNSMIHLPGILNNEYYGLDNKEKRFGFEQILIPPGDKGRGRLRGRCHPFPRISELHPMFGTHSRSRLFLDEAEAIPEGVWEETGNVLNAAAQEECMRIQVIAASNPVDEHSRFANEMEPPDGWDHARENNLASWTSKNGWPVIRMDGANCENVKQRKVIFPGFLTFEGYNQHLSNGEPTPMYWTQARGIYPPSGLESSVVPMYLLNNAVGFFHFDGAVTTIAAVDTALEGGDLCAHIYGRYGYASAFQQAGKPIVRFEKPRQVIQVEQIVEYPRGDTIVMANRIMDGCKAAGVHGRWLNVDRTGNGSGVHDVLIHMMSEYVMGTNYGWESTDTHIMAEDTETCEQRFSGIVTELFWGCRQWLEHGYIAFTPSLKHERLFKECASRKYRQVKSKIRVESKADYKARQNPSPDHADSFTLLVHLVRMNQEKPPEMIEGTTEANENRAQEPLLDPGMRDKLEYIDFGV